MCTRPAIEIDHEHTVPPTTSNYSELERLSAVETLKALANPEAVTVDALVEFLESRDMWDQFSKVTLGDLRRGFAPAQGAGKKKKRSAIAEELAPAEGTKKKERKPADGGIPTDEVERQVLPFVEGNGEVTFDDMAEYTGLDRKVLRHHVGVLVKEGKLERLGTGRTAIYSSLA